MKKRVVAGSSDDSSTLVTRIDFDKFTTTDCYFNPTIIGDTEVDSGSSDQDSSETKKKSKGRPGRFYKFVKKHFLSRKGGPTNVEEIHIVPDGDDLRWARRSAGSAASRSSEGTTSSEDERLEVVHDMDEEYTPATL